MKNGKQNIFSKEELENLGFKREDAGGFYYYIKYLGDENDLDCEALVTEDFQEDESVIRFTVNLVKDPVLAPLNRKDITLYIDEQA